MALVTYPARLTPLLLLADRRLPPRTLSFLRGFPVAVLAAFVAPLILMPDGRWDISLSNEELLVAIPTAAVSLWSKSLIVTVVVGSVLMLLLRALT